MLFAMNLEILRTEVIELGELFTTWSRTHVTNAAHIAQQGRLPGSQSLGVMFQQRIRDQCRVDSDGSAGWNVSG